MLGWYCPISLHGWSLFVQVDWFSSFFDRQLVGMVGGTGCCCSCCLGLDRCVAGCAAAPVSCCSRKRNLGLGCLVFVSLHCRQSVGRGLGEEEGRHNCSWSQRSLHLTCTDSCIQHSFRTKPNQIKTMLSFALTGIKKRDECCLFCNQKRLFTNIRVLTHVPFCEQYFTYYQCSSLIINQPRKEKTRSTNKQTSSTVQVLQQPTIIWNSLALHFYAFNIQFIISNHIIYNIEFNSWEANIHSI